MDRVRLVLRDGGRFGMRAERGIGRRSMPRSTAPSQTTTTRDPSLSLRRSETVVERRKHSYRENEEKTGFLRG